MRGRIVVTLAVVVSSCVAGSAVPAGAHEGHPTRRGRATTVAIYTAAIRQLVTVNSTFGPNHRFGRIYVLDRPNAAAVAPIGGGESDPVPLPRFSKAIRSALRKELRDLPPISFIRDQDDVIDDPLSGTVDNGGAVVTVGPITGEDAQVRVGASLYVANLAGTWLTYVIERRGSEWTVLGTTGPIAVS